MTQDAQYLSATASTTQHRQVQLLTMLLSSMVVDCLSCLQFVTLFTKPATTTAAGFQSEPQHLLADESHCMLEQLREGT